MSRGKVNSLHTTLYTNLRFLMCSVQPSQKLKEMVSEDMFVHNNSNMQGFLEVIHYLLNIWNEVKCKEKFKFCWPVLDQKQKSQFLRAACTIVQEIKETHPEAQLPNITLSFFLQPGGDKFCSLMLRITVFIMSFHISQDQPVVVLPSPVNKGKESSKEMLCALSDTAIKASFHLHANSTVAINKAKNYSQAYIDSLTKLVAEYREVSSQLEEFLVSSNKPRDLIKKVLDPLNVNALQGWQRLVQSKLDHADQLLQKLSPLSDKVHVCYVSMETLLTSSNKQSIDGQDLKPLITDTLCTRLNTSLEELSSKLFSSGTLKLQGLIEVGCQALKILCTEWSKQDMKPAEEALVKLQAIVDQAEKSGQEWKYIEEEFQKICCLLDENVEKIYESKQQVVRVASESRQFHPSAGLSGASSLLAQIPNTPPWGLRAGAENTSSQEESFSQFLQNLPALTFEKERLETERLLKLFKGELSETEYEKIKKEEEDKQSSNLNFPSNFSLPTSMIIPTSPKRSHSPVSSLRLSVNQLLPSEAPPPCKDLRLSALKIKSHSSRYTPSYKQALHQRLLQLPPKPHITSNHQNPATSNTASSYEQKQELTQSASPMDPMSVKQEIDIFDLKIEDTHSRDSKDSGFRTLTSSSLCRHIEDVNISSDDSEALFGDISLQEIAELHLSLQSTPSKSPMNFTGINLSTHSPSPNFLAVRTGVSPRVPDSCISSAVGSSPVLISQPFKTPRRHFLSPPAAGAASDNHDGDVKPSLTTLMQRLQAIKSTMKQPAPVSRTGNHDLVTPSHHRRPVIKLEIESPP